MKNWKQIVSVTRIDANGTVKHFDSLPEAISSCWYDIERCTTGRLAYPVSRNWIPYFRVEYVSGDPYLFRDEMGMQIPVWKLQEVWKQTPKPPMRYYSWRSARNRATYNPAKFRQGPVPNIHRRSFGGWLRFIKTRAEISASDFCNYDDDLIEYGIKVRGSRKRHSLPTVWDDIYRQHTKSWKKHRRTQYK